jgi:gas vesicle protein
MSSVDESGKHASDAAQPVNPESAETGAPDIKVEQFGHARHRKLDDDKAPALFVPAARQRFSRAAILAVAIALSAATGSAVGAVAAVAFAKPQSANTDDVRTIEVNALRGVITQLSSEVASLKASVEASAKTANAHMAKIADRVDRAEKAQAEPASRVAKLSELMERLERRNAAATPALAAAPAPETTGSIAAKQQDRPAVVNGWMLREVFNGGAVVENERMGVFEVVPGANLPGLGKVETIRRHDGRWVVMTPKGMIVSQR